MSKVLVTGGCGFLGAALTKVARTAGHDVVAADVLQGADRPLDATDPVAVAALLRSCGPTPSFISRRD